MYYSWGLTLSLQVVALAPIMRSYLPSCLTFFLRDLMISHGRMYWVRDWWWSLYNVVDVSYNPLTYRLERHHFFYNSVIYNCLDVIVYWFLAFALIGVFLCMRVCFVPFHYWSYHFAELERDYRFQYFIRGFQLVFLKLAFCSLLNLSAVQDANEPSDPASVIVSVVVIAFVLCGMGGIFWYIFALRNISMKKMKQRVFFQMLFDDFNQ